MPIVVNIPNIRSDESDVEYEKRIDSLGITDAQFEAWFENLMPLTESYATASIMGAGDVPLDFQVDGMDDEV